MKEDEKAGMSKSRKVIEKVMSYLDWLIWFVIGFFFREVMVRWGLWKTCPLITECTRCYQYGLGGLIG